MASVQRNGAGWRVTYREGGRGSKLLHSQTYSDEFQALDTKERIEAELAARIPVQRGQVIPLRALLLRWKADRIALGNDPVWTQAAVDHLMPLCQRRGWRTCLDVTPQAVAAWRQDVGVRARSGAQLRAVLWWAKDYANQPVTEAQLIALRPPRRKKRIETPLVCHEQVEAWIRQADQVSPDMGALIYCLSTYGWRPVSAARMTVSDGDFMRKTIRTIVKGGDHVEHAINAETVRRMRKITDGRAPTEPLFRDPRTGKAFDLAGTNSIPQWIRYWLHARAYDIKRYAITNLLDVTGSAKTTQAVTGHRTPGQVLLYERTNDAKVRAALVALQEHLGTRDTRKPPKPRRTHSRAPAKTRRNHQKRSVAR